MEKKAHNTALKNKFFIGLWFVLFTSVVLSINWLFTKPLNNFTLLQGELAVTDKHITRLQSIQAEFLLNLENKDDLLITPEKTTEEEAGSLLRSLKRDLDHFSTHKYLRTNSAIMTSLDEFSIAVSWFENSLNDFFLIAHERKCRKRYYFALAGIKQPDAVRSQSAGSRDHKGPESD